MRSSPPSKPRPRPATDKHGHIIQTRSVRQRVMEANPLATEERATDISHTIHTRLRKAAEKGAI